MSLINKLSVFLVSLVVVVNSQNVQRRFEYKYSFKPPYLAQKDGSVPFFEYGGNAIASGESVRLAPSLRSQKGAIWSKNPVNFDWWEVELAFRVTGRGRVGADGLAFWYVSEKGGFDGEVFGAADRWRGLAIMFDSFDNDNKHNNPYIMAVLNDGTKSFDHKSDGSQQMLSGCLRDFRNKPFPTRARIQYYMNTLTLFFHNGMSNNEADYDLCFRAEGVVLPRAGYFGVSAATGGLADDHDVTHLLTTSLHAATEQPAQGQPTDAEQQRLAAEYAEYQRKLQQQTDDYRKEHPDEARNQQGEQDDDWFEGEGARELRQIFQGQANMHDVLRALNSKIDEVIGKQMNALSILAQLHGAAAVQGALPAGGPVVQPQGGALPVVGRHEWEGLVGSTQLLVSSIAELKSHIIEVARRTDGGSGGVGVPSPLVAEVRDSLNQLKQSAAQTAQRVSMMGGSGGAPCESVSCVGLTGLLAVAMMQFVGTVLYYMYRDRREQQAKKFF